MHHRVYIACIGFIWLWTTSAIPESKQQIKTKIKFYDWKLAILFISQHALYGMGSMHRVHCGRSMTCYEYIYLEMIWFRGKYQSNQFTSGQHKGWRCINSLAPGGFDCSLKLVNFKLISTIDILSIFCEIAVRWMPQHLTDHWSTLVQVMAWCHQATSHYLSQCWLRSLSPYGITRTQWVNNPWTTGAFFFPNNNFISLSFTTSCAHKWGQYTPALISTHPIKKYPTNSPIFKSLW